MLLFLLTVLVNIWPATCVVASSAGGSASSWFPHGSYQYETTLLLICGPNKLWLDKCFSLGVSFPDVILIHFAASDTRSWTIASSPKLLHGVEWSSCCFVTHLASVIKQLNHGILSNLLSHIFIWMFGYCMFKLLAWLNKLNTKNICKGYINPGVKSLGKSSSKTEWVTGNHPSKCTWNNVKIGTIFAIFVYYLCEFLSTMKTYTLYLQMHCILCDHNMVLHRFTVRFQRFTFCEQTDK